jgi:hypothetical protein
MGVIPTKEAVRRMPTIRIARAEEQKDNLRRQFPHFSLNGPVQALSLRLNLPKQRQACPPCSERLYLPLADWITKGVSSFK